MGIFLVIILLIEAHTMHAQWVETRPVRSTQCNPNVPPHCDPWVKP